MIKGLLIFISLFMFVTSVFSSNVLELNFYVYGETSELVSYVYQDSEFERLPVLKDNSCNVRILDVNENLIYNNYFSKNFPIGLESKAESYTILLRAHYVEQMEFVDLSCDEAPFKRFELDFCNNNLVCDEGESIYSCSNDCNIKNDLVCTSELDGVCDKFCMNGSDPDCDGISFIWKGIISFIGILILGFSLYLIFRYRRKKRLMDLNTY